MTVSYTLDISQATTLSFFKLLFRWRGSVWKAVMPQLIIWTAVYWAIAAVYRYLMTGQQQDVFANWVTYLNDKLSNYIPLSFLLGFFVTQVVARWQHVIDGIVWIDNSAINFANFIKGNDEETCILRRTLIRYMVLNQALVLRDISMQVRERFPTSESMVAGGLVTVDELAEIQEIKDAYTRYWLPLNWCYALLYNARQQKKICSDHILEFMIEEVQHFRQGLATLLKYDWTPLPLVYPQVIFLAVRAYFLICLVSRQHIIHVQKDKPFDPILPILTLVEFFVFIGWMKVAEALLNPLGVDDDDIEVNYILDKNLIAGFTIVDLGVKPPPTLKVDIFYKNEPIVPLYSLKAAKREVYPLIGSASTTNLVKNVPNITMTAHKNQLSVMNDREQEDSVKTVSVLEHNKRHSQDSKARKAADPDKVLANIRKRAKKDKNCTVHTIYIPDSNSRTHSSQMNGNVPRLSSIHEHHSTISSAGATSESESENYKSHGNPGINDYSRF